MHSLCADHTGAVHIREKMTNREAVLLSSEANAHRRSCATYSPSKVFNLSYNGRQDVSSITTSLTKGGLLSCSVLMIQGQCFRYQHNLPIERGLSSVRLCTKKPSASSCCYLQKQNLQYKNSVYFTLWSVLSSHIQRSQCCNSEQKQQKHFLFTRVPHYLMINSVY